MADRERDPGKFYYDLGPKDGAKNGGMHSAVHKYSVKYSDLGARYGGFQQTVFLDLGIKNSQDLALPTLPLWRVVKQVILVLAKKAHDELANQVAELIATDSKFTAKLKQIFARAGYTFSITLLAESAPAGAVPSLSEPPPAMSLPAVAPRLWADRDEGAKPADFIRTIYAPWIEAGVMTRAAIKVCDPQLYNAYAVRLHRHPDEVVAFADADRKAGRQPTTDLVSLVEKRRKTDREAKASKREHAKMSHPAP